ncbi:MAG: cytochrome c-type biogenesis protein [Oceanicoccus sp.]
MRLLALLLMVFSPMLMAVVETYDFDDEEKRERYQIFVEELRCPKCQNQNLAGSNSPIAKDLRRELYRLLEEGRDDEQIVEYMVNRYGEFVLYRPRFNPETAVLWLAPVIFLVLGSGLVITVFRRQKKPAGTVTETLDDSEKKALHNILKDQDGGDRNA